jgi:hypothetical protein
MLLMQAVTYLSPEYTKVAVHGEYTASYDVLCREYANVWKAEHDGAEPKGMSSIPLQYSAWCRLWGEHCSTVRVRTARSDICDLCMTLRSKNTPEASQILQIHRAQAHSAREHYNSVRKDVCDNANMTNVLHLSGDFAEKVLLPHYLGA